MWGLSRNVAELRSLPCIFMSKKALSIVGVIKVIKDVIRRVAIIKAAQKLGICLTDINLALCALPDNATPNKAQWAAMSTAWQQTLNDKISYMQKLRDSLDGCIGCGCLSMKSCPIYNPDDILAKKGPGPVILDNKLG